MTATFRSQVGSWFIEHQADCVILQVLLRAEFDQLRSATSTATVPWMSTLKGLVEMSVLAYFNPFAAGGFVVLKKVAEKYMR